MDERESKRVIFNECYSDKSESKSINAYETLSRVCSTDKSKPESNIVIACSTDKSTPTRIHISVNTSEVKDSMREEKDGETLVTDNSVINVPSYLKN